MTTAEQIARQAHIGQVEKWGGHPYAAHLERVVALVEGDDTQAVAWLHDVLEDTVVTAEMLVEFGIPLAIVDAVMVLTRRPETYGAYIERVKSSQNVLAFAVKVADLQDHLREETLDRLPPSLRQRYEAALETLTS